MSVLDIPPEEHNAWCLKIIEKVSFNIASEASYVYILIGQKLIKNAKNGQIGRWDIFGDFQTLWVTK